MKIREEKFETRKATWPVGGDSGCSSKVVHPLVLSISFSSQARRLVRRDLSRCPTVVSDSCVGSSEVARADLPGQPLAASYYARSCHQTPRPKAFWMEFEQIPWSQVILHQAGAFVHLPGNDGAAILPCDLYTERFQHPADSRRKSLRNTLTPRWCREPEGQVAPKNPQASGTPC
jgi:hypothetical protein